MKLLSEYPGLIGEVLKRADAREKRGCWWKRLLGLERRPKTHVVNFSPTEKVYSER
jgi:hypothetical protein